MAPLTWRNVDQPDLGSASDIMARAAQGFQEGFGGLGESLRNVHGIQARNRSAVGLEQLAGITGGANVDQILARVSGSVDPMYRTDALNQAILNARGTGLGYDDTNSVINVRNAGNARAQETHNWDMGVRRQEADMADDIMRAAAAANGGPQVPTGERAAYIRQGLIERGLPAHVADGFLLNFQDESGFDPGINEANPTVPGSRGGFGLYQLTGPRRVAYENFAAERGVHPSNVDAQLDFLMMELQGPEAAAARAIMGAGNTAQAADAILRNFLRPAAEHVEARSARYLGGRASIADIIPEGNMISYRDWMDIEQDIYDDGQQIYEDSQDRISDGFTNRQNERAEREAIRLEQEGEQNRQREQQAQDVVDSIFDSLGPNAAFEGVNTIQTMDGLDGETRQLAVDMLRKRIAGSEEFFSPADEARMSSTAENALASMTMGEGIVDGQNTTLRALESVGIDVEASAQDADAAVTGEGADAGAQSQGVLDQINGLMQNKEALGITDDPARILGIVQDIAGELNLDPRVVMAMARESFGRNTMGLGMSLDEDLLRANLEPWADPDSRRQLIEEQRQQVLRQQELNDLISQQQAAMQEIDVFSRRDGTEAEQRVADAEQQVAVVDKAIQALVNRDAAASGEAPVYSRDGREKQEEETVGGINRILNARTSDERREAIVESTNQVSGVSPVSLEERVSAMIEDGDPFGIGALNFIRSGKLQELLQERPELASEFERDPVEAYVKYVLGNQIPRDPRDEAPRPQTVVPENPRDQMFINGFRAY